MHKLTGVLMTCPIINDDKIIRPILSFMLERIAMLISAGQTNDCNALMEE